MKKTKTTDTTVAETASVSKPVKVKKEKIVKEPAIRGRKVSPTSARQIRLARFAEMRSQGKRVGRGRPVGSKEKKD